MRKRDLVTVGRLVADFLYGYGFMLLAPMLVGIVTGEYEQAICFGVGALLFIPVFYVLRRRVSAVDVEKRHAAIALALTWILLSLFSSIPFLLVWDGLDRCLVRGVFGMDGYRPDNDPTSRGASLLAEFVSCLDAVDQRSGHCHVYAGGAGAFSPCGAELVCR